MIKENKRISNISDKLYEFNFKIMENNYNFSLLENTEIDTYTKTLRERKQIYFFKPKINSVCFTHLSGQTKIYVSSEAYFMTRGIAWTKVIREDFKFEDKFLDNINFDEKNPQKNSEWNGLKIYIKEDLEQYIESNFKTNIGFNRYYKLLKKMY